MCICLRNDSLEKTCVFGIDRTFTWIQVWCLGANGPFIKKIIQFRYYYASCLMWLCGERTTTLSYKERSIQKELSITPLLDELFCFQIRFLTGPKHLHQIVNRNLRSDYIFFDMNLRRNHIFDSIRVLGIDRRLLTGFIVWFWDRRTFFLFLFTVAFILMLI